MMVVNYEVIEYLKAPHIIYILTQKKDQIIYLLCVCIVYSVKCEYMYII